VDAALGAIAPRRGAELRAHLESCPGCRAALEERKELVAAIDRGIRDNLAGEASRGFAARLRRRLAEESPAKLSWAEAWAPWLLALWLRWPSPPSGSPSITQ
jgi:anti-sigma factor RsiW